MCLEGVLDLRRLGRRGMLVLGAEEAQERTGQGARQRDDRFNPERQSGRRWRGDECPIAVDRRVQWQAAR